MKSVILLRHVSGAGSSTFARFIDVISAFSVRICSADDFFLNEKGEYNFDAKKLGLAHNLCRDKFRNALEQEVETIIVSNTLTTEKEFQPYIDEAKNAGYMVFSLVIENRHGNKDVHLVPEATLQKQQENIKNSLKLR